MECEGGRFAEFKQPRQDRQCERAQHEAIILRIEAIDTVLESRATNHDKLQHKLKSRTAGGLWCSWIMKDTNELLVRKMRSAHAATTASPFE